MHIHIHTHIYIYTHIRTYIHTHIYIEHISPFYGIFILTWICAETKYKFQFLFLYLGTTGISFQSNKRMCKRFHTFLVYTNRVYGSFVIYSTKIFCKIFFTTILFVTQSFPYTWWLYESLHFVKAIYYIYNKIPRW